MDDEKPARRRAGTDWRDAWLCRPMSYGESHVELIALAHGSCDNAHEAGYFKGSRKETNYFCDSQE